MASHLVFVYGTLRRGHPNHHCLQDQSKGKSRFLGLATTVEKYPLVIASRFNIPYLLAAPGDGEHVRGDVYEVDDKMLKNLDILESHPKYYEREVKKVKMEDSGEENECWVYTMYGYKSYMMELPRLKDYSAELHNYKKYFPRYLREDNSGYWSDVKEDLDVSI